MADWAHDHGTVDPHGHDNEIIKTVTNAAGEVTMSNESKNLWEQYLTERAKLDAASAPQPEVEPNPEEEVRKFQLFVFLKNGTIVECASGDMSRREAWEMTQDIANEVWKQGYPLVDSTDRGSVVAFNPDNVSHFVYSDVAAAQEEYDEIQARRKEKAQAEALKTPEDQAGGNYL